MFKMSLHWDSFLRHENKPGFVEMESRDGIGKERNKEMEPETWRREIES
jgi:hypothetical protein